MTRELKFRVWDGKEMYPFTFQNLTGWDTGDVYIEGGHPELNRNKHQIMQWTGLMDKNGVEIYEGDIVKISHPFKSREWGGEVKYKEYGFIGAGFFFPHFDNPGDLFSEGTQYISVIGNIYDKILNPTP